MFLGLEELPTVSVGYLQYWLHLSHGCYVNSYTVSLSVLSNAEIAWFSGFYIGDLSQRAAIVFPLF